MEHTHNTHTPIPLTEAIEGVHFERKPNGEGGYWNIALEGWAFADGGFIPYKPIVKTNKRFRGKKSDTCPKAKAEKPKVEKVQPARLGDDIAEPVQEEEIEEILTDDNLLDTEATNFRIKFPRFFLTYKTHINKFELRDFLLKKVKSVKDTDKTVYIAHENGDDNPLTPYEHTHVVIDYVKPLDSSSPRVFDFEGIHPHISKIYASEGFGKDYWRKACKYITKEDKTVKLAKIDQFNAVSDCLSCATDEEALIRGGLRNATQILAIRKACEKPAGNWMGGLRMDEDLAEHFFPWQQNTWDLLQYTTLRKLLWIWGPRKGEGKNTLLDYCCTEHKEEFLEVNLGRTQDDVMAGICKSIKGGWRGRTLMINLECSKTRDRDVSSMIYTLMERLVDGKIATNKFNGFDIASTGGKPRFNVVVFSNELPDVDAVALDRWESPRGVNEIMPDMTLRHMSIEEVRSKAKGTSKRYSAWE